MANSDLGPMSLGEVLDRTFSLYKGHFWLFAGIVALPYLLIYSLLLLAQPLVGFVSGPGVNGPAQPLGNVFAAALEFTLIFAAVYLCAYAAAQAATVAAVSDLYMGRKAGVQESFRRVRGKLISVLLVILLTGILVGAGTILFVIPGLFLLCRTALAVPAATLEDVSVTEALSRSMKLTKGSAMQIFLVFILFGILSFVAVTIFQAPFYLAMGSISRPHALPLDLDILSTLAAWVSSIVVAPIITIAFSLIYYNQRIHKEGFDLEQLMASLAPGASSLA